jgi:hypothetical protein
MVIVILLTVAIGFLLTYFISCGWILTLVVAAVGGNWMLLVLSE